MKTKQPLSELLQKTPKSDLEALLLEFAMNDKHIEKMLRIRLSTDVSEVQRVKSELRAIINKCSDKHGFIEYSCLDDFENQICELVENALPRFIAEKNTKAAFEIICALFLKFGKVGIDDSYGTVYTLFAPIMEYFAQVVDLMDREEKDKAFAWVENHIDDEKILPHIRDYIFEAYIVLFNDEKSLRKKIIFFDSYLEKNYSTQNLNDYKNSYELQRYAKKKT